MLRVVEDVLRYTAETHPNRGTVHDVSQLLADAIANDRSISKALDEMAVTDDPFGQAISSAICTGLGQIADANAPSDESSTATPASWRDFLVHEVSQVILRTQPVATITAEVDKLANTESLATLNPRAAYAYYRECKA